MTGPNAVCIEDAQIYARATGCSVVKALPLLNAMHPSLRDSVLLAAATQSGSYLRDPIEFDPRYAESIREAKVLAEAEALAAGTSLGRGSAHVIWHIQAKMLRERLGIEWLSPREMNPHIVFD